MGWAGLPPSIVARPEIIFEALIDGNPEWSELNFRWKPGKIDKRPLQAAPHQPRFDWMMWFAALGTLQHNPWLVSFTDKILAGCPTVLDLIDEPHLVAGTRNITRVRATLYHYDFTRLDTAWARRIPGVTVVKGGASWRPLAQVWARERVGQYLPPLERDNPSLRQFLQQAGYGQSSCITAQHRCTDVGTAEKMPCRAAAFFRQLSKRVWALPLVAFLSCCLVEWWGTSRQRKASTQEKLKFN
jgi:hypothetical protein